MLRSIAGAAVFGRFGLRAGWSMAIAVLLFLVLNPWTLSRASEPKEIKPGSAMLGETLALGAACIVTLAMALIERRRMAVYGLSRARLRDLFAGAFCGLTALSLLVFTLRACHVLVFDRLALKGPAIYLYGAKWLLVFLLVGLFEEYSTRGFLQYTLTRGMMGIGSRLSPRHARGAAFWIAAAIMSVVFGVLHLGNQGETRSGILMVFCAGLLFSYALWRTGSLWWAIGFHTAWDWAQSFLYGVPDSGSLSAGRLLQTHATGRSLLSGGADGPEGSVLVLPTLLLVAFIIRFTTQAGPQPPLEPESRQTSG
jgi:membrane protease YdiL (CAAX protease family)